MATTTTKGTTKKTSKATKATKASYRSLVAATRERAGGTPQAHLDLAAWLDAHGQPERAEWHRLLADRARQMGQLLNTLRRMAEVREGLLDSLTAEEVLESSMSTDEAELILHAKPKVHLASRLSVTVTIGEGPDDDGDYDDSDE